MKCRSTEKTTRVSEANVPVTDDPIPAAIVEISHDSSDGSHQLLFSSKTLSNRSARLLKPYGTFRPQWCRKYGGKISFKSLSYEALIRIAI
jgi:hypothetical protein